MRNLKFLILLLFFFSCKQTQENITELTSKNTQLKNTFSSKNDLEYPFGLKLSEFKKDSLNKYGAGDCWGNVRQLSKDNTRIGIDSTSCGEYGFYHNFYFIKNEAIRIAHLKESQTLHADKLEDTKYILTEKIYDYREMPHEYYVRSDTLVNSNFNEIKKGFSEKSMEDFQRTYQHLKIGYEEAWKMEIDY